MVPYEALYGRPYKSPIGWTEVEENSITGPDLIRDTLEKVSFIRQRLLTAQSLQKNYADVRRRPLEFEVGDHVFLRVIPKREVVRFGKHEKLSSRYIGPFEILERIGVRHVRCPRGIARLHTPEVHSKSSSCSGLERLRLTLIGTFEEGPVFIVASCDQVLRRKTMRLVRVLWRHCGVEESTWEHEDTMRATYPFLFKDEGTWFSRLRFKRLVYMHGRMHVAYACV